MQQTFTGSSWATNNYAMLAWALLFNDVHFFCSCKILLSTMKPYTVLKAHFQKLGWFGGPIISKMNLNTLYFGGTLDTKHQRKKVLAWTSLNTESHSKVSWQSLASQSSRLQTQFYWEKNYWDLSLEFENWVKKYNDLVTWWISSGTNTSNRRHSDFKEC